VQSQGLGETNVAPARVAESASTAEIVEVYFFTVMPHLPIEVALAAKHAGTGPGSEGVRPITMTFLPGAPSFFSAAVWAAA